MSFLNLHRGLLFAMNASGNHVSYIMNINDNHRNDSMSLLKQPVEKDANINSFANAENGIHHNLAGQGKTNGR